MQDTMSRIDLSSFPGQWMQVSFFLHNLKSGTVLLGFLLHDGKNNHRSKPTVLPLGYLRLLLKRQSFYQIALLTEALLIQKLDFPRNSLIGWSMQ